MYQIYQVLAGHVEHLGGWLDRNRQYYYNNCISVCGKGRHVYALILKLLSTRRAVDQARLLTADQMAEKRGRWSAIGLNGWKMADGRLLFSPMCWTLGAMAYCLGLSKLEAFACLAFAACVKGIAYYAPAHRWPAYQLERAQ